MSKPWKTTATVYSHKTKAHVEVSLALDIDWAAIAKDLGQKALNNKSGRSIALGGHIKARVL